MLELRGGNEEQIGKIIEAGTGIVGRKERSEVDRFGKILEREQIANRVPVFSTSQAVKGGQLARIGTGRGRAIEMGLQLCGHCIVRGFVRPELPGRGHRASPKLPYHLFPRVRRCAHSPHVHLVEREPGRAEFLVVAGDAVSIEHRARRARGWNCTRGFLGRAGHRDVAGGGNQHCHPSGDHKKSPARQPWGVKEASHSDPSRAAADHLCQGFGKTRRRSKSPGEPRHTSNSVTYSHVKPVIIWTV